MSDRETINVIGGGIAGLTLALELARRGLKVNLYEQEYPGYSASGKSAGIIVTIFDDELLSLALESARFYKQLPDSKGRISDRKAAYFTNNIECLEKLDNIYSKYGLEFQYYLNRDILGLEYQSLGNPAAIITTFLLDTGWAINALISKLGGMNVKIITSKVRVRGGDIISDNGKKLKGLTIIAAGPWTPMLVEELGYGSELRGKYNIYRCQIASVEGPTPKMIIEDDVLDYYLVPVSTNRFNIGDGPNRIIKDPYDGFIYDPEDTYGVLERYSERVPLAWESRIIQIWAAPCIVGSDGLPIIYKLNEKIIIYTGFDGAGITLAPAFSRLLANSIINNKWELPRYTDPKIKPVSSEVREPYYITC